MKQANATRKSGDLYDVTYPHTSDLDRNVHGSYLVRLVRKGYEVHCDNAGYDEPQVGRLVSGEVVWAAK